MTNEISAVVVKRLPKAGSPKQSVAFLRELEASMDAGRPRIVIDCSAMHGLAKQDCHTLLGCLEEAMKRNGDVRLAAIPAESADAFRSSGLMNLFEVFEAVAEAVASFESPSHVSTAERATTAAPAQRSAGNAA